MTRKLIFFFFLPRCTIKLFIGHQWIYWHYNDDIIWSIHWHFLMEGKKDHHHHVVQLARISLTLSLHVSLSFIASGRSSGLHPVSSHHCCMYVRAGRPAFDWPYAGVHRSTSLTISSLLLQQCPACLVRLACIVFMIGGRWPYSWCLVGCCYQDLFNLEYIMQLCNLSIHREHATLAASTN